MSTTKVTKRLRMTWIRSCLVTHHRAIGTNLKASITKYVSMQVNRLKNKYVCKRTVLCSPQPFCTRVTTACNTRAPTMFTAANQAMMGKMMGRPPLQFPNQSGLNVPLQNAMPWTPSLAAGAGSVPMGYTLQQVLVKDTDMPTQPSLSPFARRNGAGTKGTKKGGGKKGKDGGKGEKGKQDAKGKGKYKTGKGGKVGKGGKRKAEGDAGEGKGAVPATATKPLVPKADMPKDTEATTIEMQLKEKKIKGQNGKWARDALVFAAGKQFLSRKAVKRLKTMIIQFHVDHPTYGPCDELVAAAIKKDVKAEQEKAVLMLAKDMVSPGAAASSVEKPPVLIPARNKVSFADKDDVSEIIVADADTKGMDLDSGDDEEDGESKVEPGTSKHSPPSSSGTKDKGKAAVVDAPPVAAVPKVVLDPKPNLGSSEFAVCVPTMNDQHFWVAELGLTDTETMAASSMLSDLVASVNSRTISRAGYLKSLIAATVVVIQDGAAPLQHTKSPSVLHHAPSAKDKMEMPEVGQTSKSVEIGDDAMNVEKPEEPKDPLEKPPHNIIPAKQEQKD